MDGEHFIYVMNVSCFNLTMLKLKVYYLNFVVAEK